MKENGVLLFSKNFLDENFDSDILIGFFASIANFSREALNSVVKNVDLGANNRLVLHAIPEEKLLGAIIGSSLDNTELINEILLNVMLDFIDNFSPNYEIEQIKNANMEKLIDDNLKSRIMQSPRQRYVLSWFMVGPLSYFLMLISIYVTQLLYSFFNVDILLFSQTQIFTELMPALAFLSTANVFILFLLPNLILGYLTPSKKVAYLSSIIHLSVVLTLYSFSTEPLFAFIIVAYLPFAFFLAIIFCYIGLRLSWKKKLVK